MNTSIQDTISLLLVGSDPEMLGLLDAVLSEAGFAAERIADLAALDEHLASSHHDLVLCDEVVGELDGLSVFEAYRLERGDRRGGYLLLADDADGTRIATGLAAGLDEIVVKPFDVDELVARLQKVHARRARAREKANAQELIGFQGDLEYLNLPDILINLHQNARTGKLCVRVEEGEYVYTLRGGDIIAVTGPNGLKSRKAFYRAMRESEGSFRFIVDDTSGARRPVLFDNVANIILQAVQEADEYPLTRANLPPDPVAVHLTERVQRVRLPEQTAIQPLLEGLIQSTTIDILIHACPRTDLEAARELEELMRSKVLVCGEEPAELTL